jgi:hypothetical protein
MSTERSSFKTARLLFALGLIAALAAVGALSVLTERSAASSELRPIDEARAPSALQSDISPSDHATVNPDTLEPSPALPALSIAAYGS